MQYLLIAIYLVFTTGGITFMKLGGDSLKLSLAGGFSLAMGWKTFIGFAMYLVSFLLWQRIVVKYNISMVVPIVNGIVQLAILVIGLVLFKEKLSTLSLIGALFIVSGIVLMAFGAAK